MAIPTIQLAFQGGGAKLAAMLPIADAFRLAEEEGCIKITRTSGTSAGAICAALIATRGDFEGARRYILDKGPKHLAELIPSRLRNILKKKKRGHEFGLWDLLREHWMVREVAIKGKPLLQSAALSQLIKGLLKASKASEFKNIEQCPIDLFITASNVVAASGVTHEAGDLIAAIEDSCSLPVLLRSFASLNRTHHVDGALCDNLPVECLLSEKESPVFAVYPEGEETRRDNSNILSYFFSLLSASINHNVKRSISLVENAYRFPASTDIDLLDFEGAIAQLGDHYWYRAQRDEALARIRAFSRTFDHSSSSSQSRVVDTIDVDQYRSSLSRLIAGGPDPSTLLRGVKGQFIVYINDDRRGNREDRLPDTIRRFTQLEVLTPNLRFHRATVNVAEDSIVPTVWSARNLTRNTDVPIVVLSLDRDNLSGVAMRHCLLEFLEPENHFGVGDVLELQSSYHSSPNGDMRNVNNGKADHFGFTNHAKMVIEQVELILRYPKSLGQMRLIEDPSRCRNLTTKAQDFTPDSKEGLPLDLNLAAIGMRLQALQPEAAFYVQAIPLSPTESRQKSRRGRS